MVGFLPAPCKSGSTAGVSLSAQLSRTFAPLVNLVYPPRCPACGEGTASQTGLCLTCWSSLEIPAEPSCVLCQYPLDVEEADANPICLVCATEPPVHSGIAAGTVYNDTSRRLILAFKHGRRIALSRLLSGFIAARLPGETADHLIVPVPLHRLRLWQRGFNQAALLARDLERLGKGRLVVDGLVRATYTRPLGNLGQQERKRILAGSITVNPRRVEGLKGAKIILVDDVLTSGATTNACAQALKDAGAAEVIIACAARKLR